MSRVDNLRFRDRTTERERIAMAKELLLSGKNTREAIAAVRERFGMGVGAGTVMKLRNAILRAAAKAERKSLAKQMETHRPEVATKPALPPLVLQALDHGLRCIVNPDGSLELRR